MSGKSVAGKFNYMSMGRLGKKPVKDSVRVALTDGEVTNRRFLSKMDRLDQQQRKAAKTQYAKAKRADKRERRIQNRLSAG